jgi:predicted O-linked N-acetylglucosamine transferase (SPINDLY family)
MKKIIITESQYKRLFNENVLTDMSGDILRDLFSAVPVAGDMLVAVPSIIRNVKQIKSGTNKLKDAMSSNSPNNTIEKLQKNISIDLKDLVQSILGASPDPGLTELISIISSVADNTTRILGQDVLLVLLSKEKKILSLIEKFLTLNISRKLIPKNIDIRFIVLDAFKTLKESVDYLGNEVTAKTVVKQVVDKETENLKNILGDIIKNTNY